MAGQGSTPLADEVLSIALELKTNFAKELMNATAQLGKFGDRATTISKTAIGSLESLNRQFAGSLRSMFTGTASEMQTFVNAISGQVGILENSTKRFVGKQIEATDSLKKQYDDALKYANRVNTFLERIQKKKTGFIGPSTKEGRGAYYSIDDIKNLQYVKSQFQGSIESFKANLSKVNQELILNSATLIKKSATDITNSSVRSLEFISKTAQDIMARGRHGKMGLEMMGAGPALLKQTQTYGEAKEGRGVLSSLYKDQASRVSALVRMRKELEFLAKLTSDPKMAIGITEMGMAVAKMEEKTRQAMMGMRTDLQSVHQLTRGLAKDLQVDGVKAGQELRNGIIRGSSIETVFGKMFQAYGQQVVYATRQSDQAFIKASVEARNLKDQISGIIQKLKEQGREADALKRTGHLPESAYTTAKGDIASRLEQIATLSERIKLIAKEFKQLAMPKDFGKMMNIDALKKATMSLEEMQNRVKSFGNITRDNFGPFVSAIRRAQTEQESFSRVMGTSQERVNEAIRLSNRIAELSAKDTTGKMKIFYKELYDYLKAQISQAHATMSSSAGKRVNLEPMLRDARIMAIRVHTEIKKTVPSADEMKSRFNDIHALYDKFTIYQQQTMQKWFVGAGTRAKATGMYSNIRSQVDAYREEFERIKNLYQRLQTIQNAGMGNKFTDRMLANTRDTLNTMRTSMLELGRVNDQAGKKMEMIQQKSISSSIKSGWELIRNFRWQTAALGYFIYAGINNVKRFVIGVFDEIYEFRKQSLSLAASFSYQMLGDTKENFDIALSYSRNLLVQMQIVAAKTSLSMEDMINLVRTFAQAGIIPKGTADLEKIAAIGTAIQAVTEGMANAGTQMKQELNALILGRQRATDSLAMMFQFMGVNIKDLMKKAKQEGANMLDVFAGALEPFNEMMGRMKDEWGSVKNRIDIAWESLKRFALEGFLINLSKNMAKMIGKYFDESTGQLTEKGKQIAQLIKGIYETAGQYISFLFSGLGLSLSILNDMVNAAYDLKVNLLNAAGTSAEFEGNYRGVLNLFKEILHVVWLISNTISAMVATLKLPIVTLISLVEAAKGAGQYFGGAAVSLITGIESKRQKEGAERLKKAWANVSQASLDIWNLPANAQKGLNDIEEIFRNINKLTKEAKKNVEGLVTFKLPVDIKQIGDAVKSLQKHFETYGISDATIRTLSTQMSGYTDSVKGQIKQVVKANDEVESAIEEAAKKYGISADIIRAVAWKESKYNPNLVSRAGAQGIMQIMPETGKELGLKDPFNMKESIDAGAKYLKQLSDQFKGDLALTLAAYNAGPGNVVRAGGIPKHLAETVEYVKDLTGETDRVINTLGINIEKLASKGPELFAEQAQNKREEYIQLEKDLRKNIDAITELVTLSDRGEISVSQNNLKFRTEQKVGFEQMLSTIKVYYALVDAEEKHKTGKWIEDENKKAAHAKSAYTKLLEDLSGKPMTMGEKYDDWYKDQVRKIVEFEDINGKVSSKTKALWEALAEGSADYWKKMLKESDESFKEFENSISSHKTKTPFETIRLEFEKKRDELGVKAHDKTWTPDMIRDMKELIGKYEEERIQVERVNQQYDVQLKKMDFAIKKNEYFAGSFSPILQEQGALNALVLTHAKDIMEVERSLADIDVKWKDLNGNWRNVEGIEYVKEIRESYVDSLVYMQRAFEREFFRKQHPLWTELVEMSKGWADGMTDALADVVDQTKTLRVAFQDLQKAILRDFTKAVIKNYITKPMMDVLGGREPGSPTLAQKVAGTNSTTVETMTEAAKAAAGKLGFGGAKGLGVLDTMLVAGKPIPVYIVTDPNQILNGVSTTIKETNKEIKEAVEETTNSVETGTNSEKGLFSQLLASISSLHSYMAGGGAAGSGGGGGFGGLFSSIMGMFGGGSTATGMTPNAVNSAGQSYYGWGGQTGGWFGSNSAGAAGAISEVPAVIPFADGGTIKEQIIGRGLSSGSLYTFGERTQYGENEVVSPIDKLSKSLKSGGAGMSMNVQMPINIKAIDTQSGVEFLMKNSHVIESTVIRGIRNNRRIRDAVRTP